MLTVARPSRASKYPARRPARAALLALAITASVLAVPANEALTANPASSIVIAPHRALYRMHLSKDSPPGVIVGGEGVMVFEWTESCDSWEINQRMALQLVDKSEQQLLLDASFSSSESKDGLSYRFSTRTKQNGEVEKDIQGRGRLESAGGPGEVVFSQPSGARLALPRGTIFPTEHVLALLRAARAGDKHMTRVVYDGDNVETPYEVSAAIGRRLAADKAPVKRPLADEAFWRMRLAYYPLNAVAERPETEISIDLQEDGVARSLVLDYGEYILDVVLESVEPLPRPDC